MKKPRKNKTTSFQEAPDVHELLDRIRDSGAMQVGELVNEAIRRHAHEIIEERIAALKRVLPNSSQTGEQPKGEKSGR